MIGFLTFIGRIAVSAIFAWAAINHARDFNAAVLAMKSQLDTGSVALNNILMGGALAFLVIGVLCLVFGFKARFGAFLLIVYLAMVTPLFHDFWTNPAGSEAFRTQLIAFQKNLAIIGALAMIMGMGPGPWSADDKNKRLITVSDKG